MRHTLMLFCLVLVHCTLPVFAQVPLTTDDITLSSSYIQSSKDIPKGVRFVSTSLVEPSKGMKDTDRKTFSILYHRATNTTYEVIVNLSTKTIESTKKVKNVQPMVMLDEYALLDSVVRSYPQWQQAMRQRGITNLDDVIIDSWSAGAIRIAGMESARLLRGVSYLREKQVNFYGRPIEGVSVVVNMNSLKVVQFSDDGIIPLPPPSMELDRSSNPSQRPALNPTSPSAPKPNYTVSSSNEVSWQNWQFRFSMHPREGLVLHSVSYKDKERVRPLIHRMALSEMVVPYGDTSKNWIWRNAFDVGEYGIGMLTYPMDTTADIPHGSTLFHSVLVNPDGTPELRKNVIALYERDGGLLWKHYEQYKNINESRRGRELVISSIATIGNYDYSLLYVFRQDGGIEVQAQLTGIMLPKGVDDTTVTTHDQYGGHLVTRRVVAPNHQHFFCFRIDPDIDGVNNILSEIDAWSPPAATKENPHGNAIVMDEVTLRNEREAQRSMSLEKSRVWKIASSTMKNSLGASTSFLLIPVENAVPYLSHDNIIRKRAGFLNNHLWATRYKPSELYAAGDYPSQSQGGDGLPMYCADNENIQNEDLVVWYTMGITHLPRNEEYPIMNVHKGGFKLYPAGFFDYNPAMDVR